MTCHVERKFYICVRFDNKHRALWLESAASFQSKFDKARAFTRGGLAEAMHILNHALVMLNLCDHVVSITITPEEHAS